MRATPALTALAPLKPFRLWWCRLLLPMLRMVAMSSALPRLRLIHFGGWIVLGDVPGPDRRRAGPRARPTMVFLSDYDGDPSEYLAAFGIAVARGMRWTFGSAAGFPGPRPTRRFIDYVEAHRTAELLRYSAYPGATVRDVDAALEVRARLEELRVLDGEQPSEGGPHEGTGGASRAAEVHRALVRTLALAPEPTRQPFLTRLWGLLFGRSTISGFAALMPLDPHHRDEVAAAVGALARDPDALFGPVGGVHFARVALVGIPARSAGPGRGPADATVDCLLLSAWVDGDLDDFVQRLAATLGEQADTLWSGCPSYPGSDDPGRLAAWIGAHRLSFSLFLASRSGVTAEEIRAAVQQRKRVIDVLATGGNEPGPQVHRALVELAREEVA